MDSSVPYGFTLVELVIVMVITGIVALIAPALLFHGVKTMVFLPRAVAVNQVAADIQHHIVEGGFSTLAGQSVLRGLRFAVRRSVTEPALWLAEDDRIGFRASDGQSVVIRWDASVVNQEVIWRSLTTPACPPTMGTEEVLPYDAQAEWDVRVLRIAPATPVFRYYNQSGTQMAAPGCSLGGITTIRQMEIAFIAQTGNGVFDDGHARQAVTSSVAIRVP